MVEAAVIGVRQQPDVFGTVVPRYVINMVDIIAHHCLKSIFGYGQQPMNTEC
jgi:hypothetical protein